MARPTMWAPIRVSGVMIRRIGRRESDSSPPMTLSKPCPARIPRKHPYRRTRIPGVELSSGRAKAAESHAFDYDLVALTLNVGPELSQAFESRGAVGAGCEVLDHTASLGESREHGVAVGYRLVARQPNLTGNRPSRGNATIHMPPPTRRRGTACRALGTHVAQALLLAEPTLVSALAPVHKPRAATPSLAAIAAASERDPSAALPVARNGPISTPRAPTRQRISSCQFPFL